MLHSFIHPTTSLCVQTCCTWWSFWRLLIVGHENGGEGTAWGKVRKLGYIDEKWVYGSTCGKLPAESAGMWQPYVIHRSEIMCIGGSDIEMPQSFSIQLSIHTNYKLAVNNEYMIICTKLLTIQQRLGHIYRERHWSVNNIWSWKQLNWETICSLLSILNVLPAFIGITDSDTVTASFWTWASMEHLRFLVL